MKVIVLFMDPGMDLVRGIVREFSLGSGKKVRFYSLPELQKLGLGEISRLPFSIRIVLESLIRNLDGKEVTMDDVKSLAAWNSGKPLERDIPFKVSRVLMQDFTGVPAVVDLAAMRDYIYRRLGKKTSIQPVIPTDLIIDHSVQVDSFNDPQAVSNNQKMEMRRNSERYKLLKWASGSFANFRVYPPSAGICHQVNLEYLATCVKLHKDAGSYLAFPDTLVGTDSHTTMVDSLGIVGFGVGGIEAEAALLGQPVSLMTPKVLGVKLTGRLSEGVTATDFALTLTRLLREKGVVGMFVEFFGDGLPSLSVQDRATLSNMCPEYGATIALFPVDRKTLEYMKSTGRSEEQIELIKKYYGRQGMLDVDYSRIRYSDVMEVRLDSIRPSVSGPSQPKQQMELGAVSENFVSSFLENGKQDENRKISQTDYTRWASESAAAENGKIKNAPKRNEIRKVRLEYSDGYAAELQDGDVVISSITSCTNTSNPWVMIGAGILAKKAVQLGLKVDTRKVKTSFAPGSRVVIDYLKKAGLMKYLEALGFGLVGFGCITCIGNSGPLIEKQSEAINSNGLAVAAVLSGNRNYEARIHRDIRANYLMSPPLVVAYAIAGTVLKNIQSEPLGVGRDGKEVYLKEIWPSDAEISREIRMVVKRSMYSKDYGPGLYKVNPYWESLSTPSGELYKWDAKSTYIKKPPFFEGKKKRADLHNARIIGVFGDSLSTDHISPAGAIGMESPAGLYLKKNGVSLDDFNTYGSRRGNHEIMMRGTFANNRIKNLMVGGTEGGYTIHYPDRKRMSIYDAAMMYARENIPLVVIAGAEYGSGSSRDWAAKGPMLLGVKAVIAKSFERIHRSNLIGMGILPLQFEDGEGFDSLEMDYSKEVSVDLPEVLKPRQKVELRYYRKGSSRESSSSLKVRLDAEIEAEYYKAGGVLNYVIDKMLKE